MKTKFLSLFLTLVVLCTSCSKDDDDNAAQSTPTPAATGFKWKENDPNGVEKSAATATFSTQYKTMMAKDAAGALLFEINLTGTTAGTYTIGSGNAVTYVAENPYFVAETGAVIMTSNANGKVSGTFEALRSGNGLTRIYGTFTDIEVIP